MNNPNLKVWRWTSKGFLTADGTSIITESSTATYEASAGWRFKNGPDMIAALKEGLPIETFDALKNAMGISEQALASVTRIAVRTLTRRKKEGRLRPEESERLLRIGLLFDRAVEVLGGREPAQEWFTTPIIALGRVSPLDYADTEPGAREVENVLGRIEYGVFS
jgi:putative toxin-antitoxin system antitoxin component (TIGR02293 family)